ncbi:MAG: hypothetical protein AAGL69_06060 [Pseudomonadota bacterium]
MTDKDWAQLDMNAETGLTVVPITLNCVKVEESNFSATIRVVTRFYCPNLSEIPVYETVGDRNYYDPNDLIDFLPNQALEIQNAIELEQVITKFYGLENPRIALVFRVHGTDENEVVSEMVFRGKFKHVFDLREFPFDQQELAIVFRIWRKTEADFRRAWVVDALPRETVDKQMLALPDYAVRSYDVALDDNPVEATLSIKIIRRPWFYTISTTISLVVIIVLALTTFSLDLTARGDRIGITGSLLLATIAVKFVVASDVPRVSYMTKLDLEILSVFVFMLIVAVIHSFVGLLISPSVGFQAAAVAAGIVFLLMLIRPIRHWRKRVRQRKSDFLFVPKFPGS